MRRPLLVLTLGVSLSAGVLLHAADDLVLLRFSDYLDALRSQAGIPGLAAILVRANEDNWERAFGQVDIEHGMPARTDTPFHLDGTTQLITTSLILRCAEEGRLSLDDRIGRYAPAAAEPNATIRQLLSHTSVGTDGLVFSYRLERLDPLAAAIASCRGKTFRAAVEDLLEQQLMFESVPGADVMTLAPTETPGPPGTTTDSAFTAVAFQRFTSLLERLAKPYAVDSKKRATPSQYQAITLTPSGGLIASARDLARFDAELRKGSKGTLIKPESLAVAWNPPLDAHGQRLPHGLGWFVQTYNGEPVVWQFGVGDNASSSMIITVPRRAMTLILLANSQGLARPFTLAAGDAVVSPFARVFLSIFLR